MEKVNANPTVVNKHKKKKVGGVLRRDIEPTSREEDDAALRSHLEEFLLAAVEGNGEEMDVSPSAMNQNSSREAIDAKEIFSLVRDIRDPEHPLSLEELNVVSERGVFVDDASGAVKIVFTPTVPHCSMSTLIGLCLRVKLLRSLPTRFKVDIFVEPGSHVSESQVNKQLNDKERVAAALENTQLLSVVNKCLQHV
jgi:metal-sulfur cluster biosynthetic enzyme